MTAARVPEEEFIRLFREVGPSEMARRTGVQESNIYKRRVRLEAKHNIIIDGPQEARSRRKGKPVSAPQRIPLKVKDGVVLVGSDAHYWPDRITTAHRGFVAFAKKFKPEAVIMNGDVLDGATISRHARIGWEEQPSLVDEVETCKERMEEIRKAAPKDCELIWPLGNHDARFETRLANVAPEYARVEGVHLKDHFPWWEGCWSCWINDDVVVKHRFKGGIHATHNNTIWSGKTMITGHLHSQKVTPFSDYNGTRWGVDCGTLAEPYDDQFIDYTEDAPVNWRSGFIVLFFKDGEMLQPQPARVMGEGLMDFMGEVYTV